MLVGLKALAAFSGYRIQTLSTWRGRPPNADDPAPFVDVDGNVTTEPKQFRAWLIRNGKTKVQQPKNMAEIKAANKAKREAKQPGTKPAAPRPATSASKDLEDVGDGNEFESLIDLELYAAFPEPTGNIEDEIAHARQLRHRFGALVSSWRIPTLANPKTARTYRDFAAELVRQIAVIGRLEEGLVKQRLRLGRLLDEQSVMLVVERLANAVIGRFETLAGSMTDLAAQEVARIAAERGVDLSLDADRFRKLALQVFDAERMRHGEESVAIIRTVQAEQGDRMGADDEGES